MGEIRKRRDDKRVELRVMMMRGDADYDHQMMVGDSRTIKSEEALISK